MNRLARLSAQQRKRIIDDFPGEALGGRDAARYGHAGPPAGATPAYRGTIE